MFDDCAATTKMNSDESKGDYAICNSKLDNKCFIAWSPLEENKCLFKHRYVSCSRSVPRKSKRFIRYKINRSLNFDATVHNSSSENSSFEENKHLTRSAKIMRALDFNSSPAYYGKTKIKKSLNFNLTPSPKRFTPVRKSIRKSLSLNFNSLLSVPNKFLNYDDNPSDSANSSLIFSSSESIDENQNETPLQQDTKEHEMLHYSTPNAKLSRKSQCSASFRPLLRSRLKETIDNIVYVTATPTSQSLKRIKNRSKCTNDIGMNTSRNLFYEFYDKDDDRPCTPENVICIIPESMSAIKRSHKKERSSRWSDRCVTQFPSSFTNDEDVLQNRKHVDPLQDSKSNVNLHTNKNSNCKELALSRSEDDMSDTGSLFDYTEEQENVVEESKNIFENIKVKTEENAENSAFSVVHVDANTSLDKLSPKECDTSKEEFKIFTPLKRKRSLIASAAAKEHLNFYGIPSVKIELAENVVADISLSRCLTPVPNFQSNYVQTDGNNIIKVIKANNDNNDSDDNNGGETHDYGSNDTTGRSTPRNMSTTELYVNLDSIKKSHKKNKRGNSSRKGLNLFRNNFCTEEENEMSTECTESAMHSASELSNNDITSKSINDKSIDYDSTDDSTSLVVIDNEKCASTSMENELLNTTPPNCLKTKSYIRLIQDTSIKRSHKKVRDQKKQEITIETDELSDDGSIFGEEEKLDCTQDLSTHHE
ncbi:hypothetical protein WH47_09147 [Habropoda laboriosa]|uniref:Uncharacterized protein n=1 Tax=Habropoda laboriosa TaxID=597456 RepID=A0A0L7QNA6_9HYME|nr:hypothetical protein WH47_09147 [Habropoda laboriosa]